MLVKFTIYRKCSLINWIAVSSVVDPNTLDLDPDPGFWPNFDPDPCPDPGLHYQFGKKKL